MEVTTVRLPVWMLKAIDELVAQGIYANRSDFIREAIREHLRRYRKELEARFKAALLEVE